MTSNPWQATPEELAIEVANTGRLRPPLLPTTLADYMRGQAPEAHGRVVCRQVVEASAMQVIHERCFDVAELRDRIAKNAEHQLQQLRPGYGSADDGTVAMLEQLHRAALAA